MVTLKDVSKKLNIPVPVVSCAVNDVYNKHKYISRQRRQLIKQTAMEMGYVVDDMARALTTGKSKCIGYLSYNLSQDPVLPGICKAINKSDYRLMLFDEEDEHFINRCLQNRLMTVIMHGTAFPAKYAKDLIKNSIQVASLSNADIEGCIYICSQKEEGIFAGAEYLWELGHHRLCFVSRDESHSPGFDRFISSKGVENIFLCVNCENYSDTMKQFEKFYTDNNRFPTAFICANDYVAHLFCLVASKNNLSIPEDISVLTIGTGKSYGFFSCIEEQYHQMGIQAVSALTRYFEHSELSTQEYKKQLPTKLRIGYSTASPRR